ncbi:TPA: hypothetical protein ACWYG0_000127 [Raoultella ornithinolytica]
MSRCFANDRLSNYFLSAFQIYKFPFQLMAYFFFPQMHEIPDTAGSGGILAMGQMAGQQYPYTPGHPASYTDKFYRLALYSPWIFTSRFELCEIVSTADRNRVGIYVWVIFLCRHSGLQRNFVVFNKESPEGNSARIVQIEQSPKRNTLSTELSNDDHSINTS